MTTIVRLTRAELRKLVATRTFLIALALSVGISVISVAVDAWTAGKNHAPALGTAASTNQMLKLGSVCCVATLALGIIGSGSEYRHKTIIPAVLVALRRGALVIAKVIGITAAGVVLSVLTFGLGLVTAVAEKGLDPGPGGETAPGVLTAEQLSELARGHYREDSAAGR